MGKETLRDRELIDRTRKGDDAAFEEIIRRNHAAVAGLCASILRDSTQAEDAAQEIFIKAYKFISHFRGDASLSSWLYRIASNHCLDLLRQKSRARTESLDALVEAQGERLQRLMIEPAEAAASTENADLVERVLGRLPPDYRMILTLREVQGLSYNELAETLECSLDAVKGRLKRAREAMEEILRHLLASHNV